MMIMTLPQRVFLGAALILSALPAQAERIISAQEFAEMTTGNTLYFNRHGRPYGAEQYRDNKQVIWTFLDGTCQRGVWYAAQDEICFLYDGNSVAQCWHFIDDDGEKRARLVGDTRVDDLLVVRQDQEYLNCPGPDVGVSYTPGS